MAGNRQQQEGAASRRTGAPRPVLEEPAAHAAAAEPEGLRTIRRPFLKTAESGRYEAGRFLHTTSEPIFTQ